MNRMGLRGERINRMNLGGERIIKIGLEEVCIVETRRYLIFKGFYRWNRMGSLLRNMYSLDLQCQIAH